MASTEALFNTTNITFPVYDLPPLTVQGKLVSYLKARDVLNLSLVCTASFKGYFEYFEMLIGSSPKALETIKALMDKFLLEATFPSVSRDSRLPQSLLDRTAIKEAFAANWSSEKVEMIFRHFFGDATLRTDLSRAHVDGLRLLASVPREEKGNRVVKNDVLLLFKAYQTLDVELIDKAHRIVPLVSLKEHTRLCQVIFIKSNRLLFSVPPLQPSSTEKEKQETMNRLACSQIIWNHLLEEYLAHQAELQLEPSEVDPFLIPHEEFSRFILQLRGRVAQPKAYSEVTKSVQDAPQGLYDCLWAIEEAYASKKSAELEYALNTLMTEYLPAYLPAFYCMYARLFAVHGVGLIDETQQLLQRKLAQISELYPLNDSATPISSQLNLIYLWPLATENHQDGEEWSDYSRNQWGKLANPPTSANLP